MVTGRQFVAREGEVLKNPTMFRKLIGGLQYVTNTRPDVSFSVNKLSRFLNSPTLKHLQAANIILRYLKGTTEFALHFKPFSQLIIYGHCDVDWAVSLEDRRSITGYCTYLGNSLISWSSRRQNVVSRSSTESEYRAVADLTAELICLV